MKINVIGGGPAGLYFAILMKLADPAHEITVLERDGPDDTFGWGIVFSDKTMYYLEENDAVTHQRIHESFELWENVDVVYRGERISIGGNRFSGIARLVFLNIMHARCRELGVDLRFHTNVTNPDDWRDCDLLVGGDGANSLVRETYAAAFGPAVDFRLNKYIWLGTHQPFNALTLTVRENDDGLFVAHSYRFNRSGSTFIVECVGDTWETVGFERMSEAEMCAYLESVFADDLDGHALLTNNFVRWLNFPVVTNAHWSHGNIVLLGDALHTAHFSIGSGTKLALEDSIALARSMVAEPEVPRALRDFESRRRPVVDVYQQAAFESLRWLETLADRMQLPPLEFAYEIMTRSKKVDHENLRQRDPDFIARYEASVRQKGA